MAVCSQKRALCVTAIVLAALLGTALVIAYGGPQNGKCVWLCVCECVCVCAYINFSIKMVVETEYICTYIIHFFFVCSC